MLTYIYLNLSLPPKSHLGNSVNCHKLNVLQPLKHFHFALKTIC